MSSFLYELQQLINRFSEEARSNTPDFILAQYLDSCLKAYSVAVRARAEWYGRMDVPGQGSVPYPFKESDRVITQTSEE